MFFFFPFLENSLNLVSVANLWISVQPGIRECKIIHCHINYKELLSYPQQLPIANSFSVWSRSWMWSIPSVPGFCLSWTWVGNHSCCDGHAMLRRQHFTAIPCPSSTSNHFFFYLLYWDTPWALVLVEVVGEIHKDAVFAAEHMVSYSIFFYQLHISPLTAVHSGRSWIKIFLRITPKLRRLRVTKERW